MIGPAVAGMLIGAIGTGWVFIANGASFIGVLSALGGLVVLPWCCMGFRSS